MTSMSNMSEVESTAEILSIDVVMDDSLQESEPGVQVIFKNST